MKKVLVVDDDHILCRLTCDILETEGFQAVAAFSGAEALNVLEDVEFDLLITDYRMEGMDGVQLARHVRSRKPEIPIIMVTAYGPIEAEEIRICLAKEGLFPGLLETIRECLLEAASPRH
jgi:CheY-like chemotaxis protein